MTNERHKLSRKRQLPTITCPLLIIVALLFWPSSSSNDASRVLSRRMSQLFRGAPNVENDSFALHNTTTAPLLLNSTIPTVPLHATTGTHHVYVYVGSPPQRQTLIIDTGSRLVAFPCARHCLGCGRHASQFYKHEMSTTHVIPKCGSCYLNVSKCSDFSDHCIVTQKYTEGSSWTAFETEDVVWLGTESVEESVQDLMQLAVPYTFCCQMSEKGLFRKQYADGILGVALHEANLIQTMYQEGAITRNSFSLCFTRTGGRMSLGGSRTEHHLEPMKFSNLSQQSHGYYSLQVVNVSVGNVSITNSRLTLDAFTKGKGTILDSGTTDTFLPEFVAKKLTQVWRDWSGLPHSNEPRFYTLSEFEQLPDVTITFAGNVTLIVSPENYMEGVPSTITSAIPFWKGKRQLTNRLYVDEPQGAVLGANAMFGHDILFDIQDRRVGLARADCSVGVGVEATEK